MAPLSFEPAHGVPQFYRGLVPPPCAQPRGPQRPWLDGLEGRARREPSIANLNRNTPTWKPSAPTSKRSGHMNSVNFDFESKQKHPYMEAFGPYIEALFCVGGSPFGGER